MATKCRERARGLHPAKYLAVRRLLTHGGGSIKISRLLAGLIVNELIPELRDSGAATPRE